MNHKKAISIFLLSFSLMLSTATSEVHASEGKKSPKKPTNIIVTVTNNETGKSKITKPGENFNLPSLSTYNDQTPSLSIDTLGENSSVTGYEVFIPIEGDTSLVESADSGMISILSDLGTVKTDGGVTARLNVNYDVSGDKIRLNRLWGSWTPSSSMYSLSSRRAEAHAGVASSPVNKITKFPTTNSFSYTTGFGYNIFIGGQAAPRAWSSAVSSVSGMSATYTIKVEFTYP